MHGNDALHDAQYDALPYNSIYSQGMTIQTLFGVTLLQRGYTGYSDWYFHTAELSIMLHWYTGYKDL